MQTFYFNMIKDNTVSADMLICETCYPRLRATKNERLQIILLWWRFSAISWNMQMVPMHNHRDFGHHRKHGHKHHRCNSIDMMCNHKVGESTATNSNNCNLLLTFFYGTNFHKLWFDVDIFARCWPASKYHFLITYSNSLRLMHVKIPEMFDGWKPQCHDEIPLQRVMLAKPLSLDFKNDAYCWLQKSKRRFHAQHTCADYCLHHNGLIID